MLWINRSILFYTALLVFVFSWWTVAFRHSFWKLETQIGSKTLPIEFPKPRSPLLSSLHREELIKALQGDFALMAKKIIEWDADAVLLEVAGAKNMRRLSSRQILKSHYLARKIEANINTGSQHKFLPQTYASATFLLTLLQPEAIAALPAGFRNDTRLFPRELTDRIPFNLDRFEMEKDIFG